MSDAEEKAKTEEGVRGATVTDLPDKARRGQEPPAGAPDGGGGFWKLSTFVLLAALIVSGGFNLQQLGAQGDLESEAAESAVQLAYEISRADEAEQTATALRELVGDVHTNMTALQDSISEMLASTNAVVAGDDESAAAAPEAEVSSFDAAFEAASDALETASDAASEGADAVVESATSVFEEATESASDSVLPEIALPDTTPEFGWPEFALPPSELPDVSAPFIESAPAEGVPAPTSDSSWTNARDWFTGQSDRAE